MERTFNPDNYVLMENGHCFKKWSALSQEEKQRNTILTNAAIEWMRKNPGSLLTYSEMNSTGLLHVYSFKLNDYNATHQWTQIKVENDGLRLVSTN